MLSNVETALRGGIPNIGSTPSAPTGTQCSYASGITRTLVQGDADTSTAGQVTLLQKLLALDSSVYPEGLVTGYFGAATLRAVGSLQAKKGILASADPALSGYGIVGTRTRAALMSGCSPSSSIPLPSSTVVTPGAAPKVEMHFVSGFARPGQPATLVWSSTNATKCTLDDGTTKEDIFPNGSKQVYPTGYSSYKISCTNDSDPYNLQFYSQTLTASSTAPVNVSQ